MVSGPVLMVMSLSAVSSIPATPSRWNQAIIEIVDLDSLSLSPDGKSLLFRTAKQDVSTNSTIVDWYSADTDRGVVVRIGSAGTAIYDDPGVLRAEPPLWLAGGDVAVLRQHFGGATALWAYRRPSGTLTKVVAHDGDIEAPKLDTDGESIDYKVGPSRAAIRQAEEEERDVGIRISPRTDLAQSLFRGGSVEGRKASQRLTGYWYMRGGLLVAAPRQTWRWNSVTGNDEPIGPPAAPTPFKPPILTAVASIATRDGSRADAQWDGFTGRLEWQAKGFSKINCRHTLCRTRRVSSLAWQHEGRALLVTFADRHLRQTLALWDLGRNRLSVVATGEGLLSGSRNGMTPCAVGQEAAFCVAADVAGPPRLIRLDLKSTKSATLFNPNRTLRSFYRPTVERLALRLPDKTPVAGWLLSDRRAGAKTPLFVNYYRCEGFIRGGEGDEWPIAALLEAGYRVACVNSAPYRGDQDAVKTYDQGVQAVRTLIEDLSTSGKIDARRVAMAGFSFGSEVTMRTAMKSGLLGAASIASAQSAPDAYWLGAITGPTYEKTMRSVWGLGAPDETPDQWKAVSPALNASSIKVPLLMQLPEQEARHNAQLFVKLRDARTPVDFYAFPDEAHILVEPRHRLAAADRTFDWFTFWLDGRRDPDPTKADQYRRWDQMRLDRGSTSDHAPAP